MRKQSGIFLAFLALLSLVPASLLAHGGGQLVAGPDPVGPYEVSVWVNPPQPRAGEPIHFTVGVATPGDRAPVLDARILVTMQDVGQAFPAVSAQATTEQSVNRLFYETDLEVAQPGTYRAHFDVAGPEGAGALAFELAVEHASPVNWFLVGLGGLALVLVLGWWLSRRSGRTEAAPAK